MLISPRCKTKREGITRLKVRRRPLLPRRRSRRRQRFCLLWQFRLQRCRSCDVLIEKLKKIAFYFLNVQKFENVQEKFRKGIRKILTNQQKKTLNLSFGKY